MRKRFIVVFSLLIIISAGLFFWAYTMYFHTYDLEINKRYVYSVSYTSNTVSNFLKNKKTDKVFKGNMNCDLEMFYSPVKEKNDVLQVVVGISRVDNCSFILNNEEIFKDRDFIDHIFMDRFAVMEINENGYIKNLYFKKDEDPIFLSTIKLLLGDSQFITGSGFSWQTEEKSQHGYFEASYSKDGGLFSDSYIKKVNKYTKILSISQPLKSFIQKTDSSFKVRFSDSLVKSYMGHQNVFVKNKEAKTIFSLRMDIASILERVEKSNKRYSFINFNLSTPSSGLGSVVLSDRIRKKILKETAKNMNYYEIKRTLEQFAESDVIYDKGTFKRRAVAYLKLHPEKSSEIYDIFVSGKMNYKSKLLAMGILASTGHEEAQETMRKILDSKKIQQKDIYYSIYLQNFMVLKDPDKKTVNKIDAIFRKSLKTGKNLTSAAITLGAMAGKLRQNHKNFEALKINNKLKEHLSKAEKDKDKERFLDAISNTGFASNIKIAEQYSNDSSNRIRASTANVVRFNQTAESEKFLFKLAGDKDRLVRMQAINTLAVYDLTDEHLEELNRNIKNNVFNQDDYLYLLQIYSKYENKKDIVREGLLEMKKRPTSNAHLRATIENMLKK